MDDILIESLESHHVDPVLAIERDLFPAPWSEPMFVQEVEEKWLSRSFVALVGDEVVGYIIAWMLRDEVHVLNLAVARAFQRRGYARRMMVHMIDLAKAQKCRLVTLEVRVSNMPARILYASMGFSPVGVRRRYYHDNNEDALVMTLRLEPAA